jgi:hypothetical protein
MKITTLLEAYKIEYDFTKKKNRSSIIDFIKENDIKIADIQATMDAVKKSSEYKKLLALGFTYESSALQEKRATMYFESEDGNTQITCYATGQARRAKRGGFNNSMFIASPIPTLPPTQLDDPSKAAEVMTTNLKNSIQSVLNSYEKKGNKKADGIAVVDERMKKLGFPEGFRIYLDGAFKQDKYIYMDEGQVMIDAKAGGNIGLMVLDFGKNGELGPNVDFGDVQGIWKLIIRGENIKSYKGLEKFFKSGLLAIVVDTPNVNFKELAKTMTSNNIKNVYFTVNPLEIPLMTLPKICQHTEFDKNGDSRLLKNKDVKDTLEKINKVISGDLDLLDLQDELLDAGFTKAAKQ